jgi:hypothetical protein
MPAIRNNAVVRLGKGYEAPLVCGYVTDLDGNAILDSEDDFIFPSLTCELSESYVQVLYADLVLAQAAGNLVPDTHYYDVSTDSLYYAISSNYFIEVSNTGAPFEMRFGWGDASPVITTIARAGRLVYTIGIHIITPFNGTGAFVTVGDAGDTDRLMTATENDVYTVCSNETSPDHVYGSNTPILLTINPGAGASAGEGLITVYIER